MTLLTTDYVKGVSMFKIENKIVWRILGRSVSLGLLSLISSEIVEANPVPSNDGTGTIVTIEGSQFNIDGGQFSRDQANLFHSFQSFGLTQEQIANFLSNPQIENILVRVGGGQASLIDGLLEVSGGSSNLFFMNPSGVAFGPNAILNLPADFITTTANGIEFEDGWFSASGVNDYTSLLGTPQGFAFTGSQPGAILNLADLSTQSGQNLALVGGTVISSGTLSAPNGELLVTSVPGNQAIRIGRPGSFLQLEVKLPSELESLPQDWALPVLSLPQMLTSTAEAANTSVEVVSDQVQVAGGEFQVSPGDIYVQQADGGFLSLLSSNDLTSVSGDFQATQDLQLSANDALQLRDTLENPFIAVARNNLQLQGNQFVDILALTHPETAFASGGNLQLVSSQPISADAHFSSGGSFSILDLDAAPGDFRSLYDPIISANGDVVFGDYIGSSLKVESRGSIQGGNIIITSPDVGLTGSDPDIRLLTSARTVILRAGLDTLANPDNLPASAGSFFFPTQFEPVDGLSNPGDIVVGNIQTSFGETGGNILLNAEGSITAGNLDTSTSSSDATGGLVNINASGNITLGNIRSTARENRGGQVTINSASGDIVVGDIDAWAFNGPGGDINISAISSTGDVTTGNLRTESFGQDRTGGTVSLAGSSISTGTINSNLISTTSSTLIEPPPTSTFVSSPEVEAEINTAELDAQRSEEFEQYFGRDFTRKIVDSSTIRYALHEMELQEPSTKAAVVYISSDDKRVFIRVETAQGGAIEIESIADFEQKLTEERRIDPDDPEVDDSGFVLDKAVSHDAQTGLNSARSNSNIYRRKNQLAEILAQKEPELLSSEADDTESEQFELEETNEVSRDSLVEEVENLWREIQKPGTDTHLQYSDRLYDLLIRPIEAKFEEEGIENINTLLFSMESGLRLIPLAALYDSETDQYLTEKYRISVIPNFESLDIRRSDLTKADVLAMGISEFQNSDIYPPLSAVPLELKLIQNIWNGNTNGGDTEFEQSSNRFVEVKSNQQVTLDNVRNARRDHPFQIVHLATHANFSAGSVSDSKIQLWDTTLPLNALQIDTLNWRKPPIDLLILSACQTALGDSNAELGFAGLSLQAEVKSTLASLWYVSDLATLIYMMEFYRSLGSSKTKAEAVQKTQLAMLDKQRLRQNLQELEIIIESLLVSQDATWASNTEEVLTETAIQGIRNIRKRLRENRSEVVEQLSHPFYWSAFTLIGSPW
ncbi:CHAT domain-containing protein [Leptothoe sp. LEGE 181152]|nr:CHAT domain-containing protein [Adonisia turfae]MDV3352699.1 CHAT domain-containing protein [Leptothoe sp. LEGE 181152]